MIFFKILKYDIRNGLIRNYKKWLVAVLLFGTLCADFNFHRKIVMDTLQKPKGTYADFIFFVFAGMGEYNPFSNKPFEFPALWMLIMLLIFYYILFYPYHDLMGYGKQILVNSLSRVQWWLSKCCWIVASVSCYFLLLFLTALLFCVFLGIPLSFQISAYLYQYYIPAEKSAASLPLQVNIQLFLLPYLVVVAMGMFQMLLSLLIKPIYSFSLTVAVMLASSYYTKPFMIGNYAMALRSNLLMKNGVSENTGILFTMIIIIFSVTIGSFIFKRYDIINKEE